MLADRSCSDGGPCYGFAMRSRPHAILLLLTIGSLSISSCTRRSPPPADPSSATETNDATPPLASGDEGVSGLSEGEAEQHHERGVLTVDVSWFTVQGGSDPRATQAMNEAIEQAVQEGAIEVVEAPTWRDTPVPDEAEAMTVQVRCTSALLTQHLVSLRCDAQIELEWSPDAEDPLEPPTTHARWAKTLAYQEGTVRELEWSSFFADPALAPRIARRMVARDTLLTATILDDEAFAQVQATLNDYVDHCGFDFEHSLVSMGEAWLTIVPARSDEHCIASASATYAELEDALAPGSVPARFGARRKRASPEDWALEKEASVLPVWPLDTPLTSAPPATPSDTAPDPTEFSICEGSLELTPLRSGSEGPPLWQLDEGCDDGTNTTLIMEVDGTFTSLIQEWNTDIELQPGLGGDLVIVTHDCCCRYSMEILGRRGTTLVPLARDTGCYDHDMCQTVSHPTFETEGDRVVALTTPVDCEEPFGAEQRKSLDLRHSLQP